MTAAGEDPFGEWAILELMGHRKLAGFVSEATIGGAALLRIDVPHPTDEGQIATSQYYSPSAIYCLTPVVEDVARKAAQSFQPRPVTRYELPAVEKPWTAQPDEDDL